MSALPINVPPSSFLQIWSEPPLIVYKSTWCVQCSDEYKFYMKIIFMLSIKITAGQHRAWHSISQIIISAYYNFSTEIITATIDAFIIFFSLCSIWCIFSFYLLAINNTAIIKFKKNIRLWPID